MTGVKGIIKHVLGKPLFPGAVLCLALLAGCSSPSKTVNLKIHSQPEGAYIVYRLQGDEAPCAGEWIYLGTTPFRGVRHFDKGRLEELGKITLRVMRPGYLDQVREWDGAAFWEEAEGKGVIFWTPELVPQRPSE